MFDIVFQMQEVGGTQGGPQRPFSVLDRLLLTHPVWLQLSLNKDSALYILLREPVGVCTNAPKHCNINTQPFTGNMEGSDEATTWHVQRRQHLK